MDIKTIVKQAIDAKLDPYVELAKVMFNTTEVSVKQRRLELSFISIHPKVQTND